MKLAPLAAAASCLLFANSAAADSLFDTTFAKVDGGKPCYFRSYDADHMHGHPRQTVNGIEVDFAPANADGKANTAAAFELGFSFRLKRSAEWFGGTAHCNTLAASFDCELEADGGHFTLTPGVPGGMKLAVVNRGGNDRKADQINLEGSDFAGFGKPGGDDLVFVLPRIDRKSCDTGSL